MNAAFGLRPPLFFFAPLVAFFALDGRALFAALPAVFFAAFFAAFLAICSPSATRGGTPRQTGPDARSRITNSRNDRSRPIDRLQGPHHQVMRVIGFLA